MKFKVQLSDVATSKNKKIIYYAKNISGIHKILLDKLVARFHE